MKVVGFGTSPPKWAFVKDRSLAMLYPYLTDSFVDSKRLPRFVPREMRLPLCLAHRVRQSISPFFGWDRFLQGIARAQLRCDTLEHLLSASDLDDCHAMHAAQGCQTTFVDYKALLRFVPSFLKLRGGWSPPWFRPAQLIPSPPAASRNTRGVKVMFVHSKALPRFVPRETAFLRQNPQASCLLEPYPLLFKAQMLDQATQRH
jgi:hypothetical protein